MNRKTVLVVDDDPDLLKLLALRLGAAGYAVHAAESGEKVRQVGPLFLRCDLHEILLDFVGIALLGIAHSPRETPDVCVDDNPRDPKRHPEHAVRRFSSNATESDEFLHGRRHLSTVSLDQRCATALDALRLVPVKPRLVDLFLQLFLRRAGVRVYRAGAHTLRHTCVQRLVDAQFSLKTIGDYVGHRSAQSTKIYTKVDVAALREVAMGNGEVL